MQYDIRLPRDYDMRRIRERVATRGHALDDLPGLGIKAYLVRDVDRGGSCNSYSPFYLWTDEAQAARFLWGGGGFAGIVRDFTRPRVQTWLGGAFRRGTSPRPPVRATTSTFTLPAEAALEDVTEQAVRHLERVAAGRPDVSTAYVIDPQRWVLTWVELGAEPATSAAPSDPLQDGVPALAGPVVETFEVLHLSAPGIADLS